MTEKTVIDYTNRDYNSLVKSLFEQAAIKLPEWTDRSENDFGTLMVELFAYVGDVILFYQDRVANESFLETAIERRSVIDLLALIGYHLSTPSPATGTLSITAENDDINPVRVEVGAIFANKASPGEEPVEFVFLPATGVAHEEPRTGSGGTITFTIGVIHATPINEEMIGITSGEANERFSLAQTPVLLPRDGDQQDYITLEVDQGSGFERWEKKSTLLYSRSGDKHFTMRVDENDRAFVFFGDGVTGLAPPAGSSVRVSYLIGGGTKGNLAPDTLVVPKSGVNVPVTVTNIEPTSGGADRETIERAKTLAPKVYRALDRAVTSEDFSALAMNIPGVERAIAVSPSWNYVDIYVVAAGGEGPSNELRANIIRYFSERKMLTLIVNVREPVFVAINISAEIGVSPTRYQADVLYRVNEALVSLFKIEILEFGYSFYLSKVFEAIESIEGVEFAQSVSISAYRTDTGDPIAEGTASTGLIQLAPRQFPQLGNIDLVPLGGLS